MKFELNSYNLEYTACLTIRRKDGYLRVKFNSSLHLLSQVSSQLSSKETLFYCYFYTYFHGFVHIFDNTANSPYGLTYSLRLHKNLT